MYAYQIFNHNWVLFYDANTLELKRQVRLQDAYWFPAMAVYPDVSDPMLYMADTQLVQGETCTIDMIGAVSDPDNRSALAVTTATSADPQVARAWVSGVDLHVEALSPGQTTVNVITDSNGRLATASFTVVVNQALRGDVNMDGKVNATDATLIGKYIVKTYTLPDRTLADVNGDGTVDVSDQIMIYILMY
jgi:hypothetical protein